MAFDIPMTNFIHYSNFARKIARLCRYYQNKTLLREVERTIAIMVEFNGLNREVLKAICVELFDLVVG